MILYRRNSAYQAIRADCGVALYLRHGFSHPLAELAQKKNVPLIRCSSEKLREINPAARNFLLKVQPPPSISFSEWRKSKPDAFTLFAHGIEDPHNVGALMRSAVEFGCRFVLLSDRHSASLSQGSIHSSSGAAYLLRSVWVKSPIQILRRLRKEGFWIYGSAEKGKDIAEFAPQWPCILLVGNEGKGLSTSVLKECDDVLQIQTTRNIGSLNVSVAGGILLFHFFEHQRNESHS